jgi:subtilase family serine protease
VEITSTQHREKWHRWSSCALISAGNACWYVVGGTSEASPLTAGIVSLADQVAHHGLGQINDALYRMGDGPSSGTTDILAGNNGVFFTNSNGVAYTLPGYTAGPGYDLASGLGTPYAPRFVFQLALDSGNQRR